MAPFGRKATKTTTSAAAPPPEVVIPKKAAAPAVEESPMEAMVAFLTYGKYASVMKPLCIAGRAMHMASANSSLKWDAHSLVTLVTTAYGGGILAPLILGSRPTPIVVDAIVFSCVCALYLFTSTSFPTLYGLAPVKVFGLGLEAMFRVNLIATIVANATAAAPSLVGPVACGCVAGIGGMFLPFTKGWDALKPPLKPPIVRVLLTATFLAVAARPEAYFLPGLSPLARPVATALAVAANAVYDILAYLGTSSLLFATPPPPPPPPPPPETSDFFLFVVSLFALLAGAAAFVATESIDFVDALYLAATTLSTVGSTVDTPAGALVSVALSVFGVSLFAAATHRAYSMRLPPGPLPALALLAVVTLYLCQLEADWSIAQSAAFVLATATTTGNTHLVPTSTPSKLTTVVFIYFARPAFAALAADLAHKLISLPPKPPAAHVKAE